MRDEHDNVWSATFAFCAFLNGASAFACFLVYCSIKKSNVRRQYPAQLISIVAMCDGMFSIVFCGVYVFLWFYQVEGEAEVQGHIWMRVPFLVVRFFMFSSQLWTAAWNLEILRKLRNIFARPIPVVYHIVVWPASLANLIVGAVQFPTAWGAWLDYPVTDETPILELHFGYHSSMYYMYSFTLFLNLTTAFALLSRLQEYFWTLSGIKKILYYLVYPALFFVADMNNLYMLVANKQSYLSTDVRITWPLYLCSAQGLIISLARLSEIGWRDNNQRINANELHCVDELDYRRNNETESFRNRTPSTLRTGIAILDQDGKKDMVAIAVAMNKYFEVENATENVPLASLEVLASAACDEERDFATLIEPWKFRLLRRRWGVKLSEQAAELLRQFQLKRTGGKSAAFFVLVEEAGIVLKVEPGMTITCQTKTIMDAYYRHVLDQPSLLCRLLGALLVSTQGGGGVSVLLMECVRAPQPSNFLGRFDAKGRHDEDSFELTEAVKAQPIAASELFNQENLRLCGRDLQFLVLAGRTDYSVLVVGDCLRIIDYLQEYSFTKQSEWRMKKLRKWREPSVLPPDPYADRLHRFILALADGSCEWHSQSSKNLPTLSQFGPFEVEMDQRALPDAKDTLLS